MQTSFTLAQLADPDIAEADTILRACVHCGFCTATCPTYVLLGDELDSPRGRIYLIKGMLEAGEPATLDVVKHIDRCLSCLACMTTCPSGVHYMHLVDHARAHIEKTYRRPLIERLTRAALARIMPDRRLFSLTLFAAFFARPFAAMFERLGLAPIAAMLRLAPAKLPLRRLAAEQVYPPLGERRGRVALLTGCVADVLAPAINEAAIRVLARNGIEVVRAPGEACCGSLVHHMGREAEALAAARRNTDAWMREIDGEGLDAIIVTASGCATTIKDYGFMLRGDDAYAANAARVAGLARDVCEYLALIDIAPPTTPRTIQLAYHGACSLQHGQKVTRQPKALLARMGYGVRDIPEGHLCCGSAGTYNLLQPELATRLRERKIRNIEGVAPEIVAAGNIGCIAHIAAASAIPVVHPIELIDWAGGGPAPAAIQGSALAKAALADRPA
ncbi:MAG: glycolate oxidase subunit GlcF [Proteobacteria bacterium]|nr:glycolate oxidase subunit GlcF [Pseudomonadota bacterium]